MLTLDYPSGIFVTIDASWSRPKHYKTWGDLMLTVVGEQGVIDVDMFAQDLQIYGAGEPSHTVAGFGSDVYGMMLGDFIRCASSAQSSPIPLEDGLRNARVVIKAYNSLAVTATI
jgi:predicted dehydrogenase